MMIKFEIKNRFTGAVKFTAEIDCERDAFCSIKVGLAVKWAMKNSANLIDADLRGANLRGADLRGANLIDANLRSFKSCLWMTLTENPREAAGVAKALKEGRVNGSTYLGDCACLVGTIANVRGCLLYTSPSPRD